MDIMGTPNGGALTSLSSIKNARPVVAKLLKFDDYMPKTVYGVAKGLSYTVYNGLATTATPRNNLSEYKYTGGPTSTSTSPALTGVRSGFSGSFSPFFGTSTTNTYGDTAAYQNKIFVSKGQSSLDNVLTEHLSTSEKGVGESVLISMPRRLEIIDDDFILLDITNTTNVLVGVIWDDVVSHSGFWEIPVSFNPVSLEGCKTISASSASNSGSNSNGGIPRLELANASYVEPTQYTNFYPQGFTAISVSKYNTFARARPNELAEEYMSAYPWKFSSTTTRNSQSWIWKNGMLVVTTDTNRCYKFSSANMTSSSTTSNSDWQEQTDTQVEDPRTLYFLPYPNGYTSSDLDVIQETKLGEVGTQYYRAAFSGTDYNENYDIAYDSAASLELQIFKGPNGVVVGAPNVYGTTGIYPSTLGQSTNPLSGTQQAALKSTRLFGFPDDSTFDGDYQTFQGASYSVPATHFFEQTGVVSSVWEFPEGYPILGSTYPIAGVVYLISRSQ